MRLPNRISNLATRNIRQSLASRTIFLFPTNSQLSHQFVFHFSPESFSHSLRYTKKLRSISIMNQGSIAMILEGDSAAVTIALKSVEATEAATLVVRTLVVVRPGICHPNSMYDRILTKTDAA